MLLFKRISKTILKNDGNVPRYQDGISKGKARCKSNLDHNPWLAHSRPAGARASLVTWIRR